MSPRPTDAPPRRILLVMLSRLGDVIFSLPTLAALRRRFPDAHIAWVVEDRCADLLARHPLLDEVIVFERRRLTEDLRRGRLGTVLRDLRAFRRRLRAGAFDLAIDLQALAKSALIAWASGAPARLGSPSTYGMRELSFLFSRPVPSDTDSPHVVDRHLAVARALGARTEPVEFPLPPLRPEETDWVNQWFEARGCARDARIVVIHPAATWQSRRWPRARYAQLVDLLIRRHGVLPVFIGRAVEVPLVEEILGLMEEPALNAAGETSLLQLAALITRARLYIGNDAGPLHLAVALGTPIVAIYGPSDPLKTGPYGRLAGVVRQRIWCAPCRVRRCLAMTCQDLVGVPHVLAAAEEQLERTGVSR